MRDVSWLSQSLSNEQKGFVLAELAWMVVDDRPSTKVPEEPKVSSLMRLVARLTRPKLENQPT